MTLASFDFDAIPPRVRVDASYSKRRKKDVQVLQPEVAEKIQHWLTIRVPKHDTLLFPLTKKSGGVDRKTSKMMKVDLTVAKNSWIDEAGDDSEEREIRRASGYLTYENAAGLFADFHANRHTFITNLARAGVSPKTAQTLARHSDIRLTMNVYTHTDLDEKADAIAKLPSFKASMASVKNCSKKKTSRPMLDADDEIAAQRSRSTTWHNWAIRNSSRQKHDRFRPKKNPP